MHYLLCLSLLDCSKRDHGGALEETGGAREESPGAGEEGEGAGVAQPGTWSL